MAMHDLGIGFVDDRNPDVYGREQVTLVASRYMSTQAIALMLVCSDTHEPWLTCSLNFPDVQPLPEDCIWVKDYAENEGLKSLLMRNGIIKPEVVKRMVIGGSSGFWVAAYRLAPKVVDALVEKEAQFDLRRSKAASCAM
jgi:hypothetical protein